MLKFFGDKHVVSTFNVVLYPVNDLDKLRILVENFFLIRLCERVV